jgi:hypothetical protein
MIGHAMIGAEGPTPMRSFLALTAAAAALAAEPAAAWLIYPDRDDPSRLVVEIEDPTGEAVPFAVLPVPFNTPVQTLQGPDALTYRWRYEREAEGMAFLRVDEDGTGTISFEFTAHEMVEGRRLGAAAVLLAGGGTPLHTFFARTAADSLAEAKVHRIVLEAQRPPEWWQRVEAIAFLYMTYHPLQKLDDEGVRQAMRRAAERVTKGQGTEQWG